jgi:hypothetical protein
MSNEQIKYVVTWVKEEMSRGDHFPDHLHIDRLEEYLKNAVAAYNGGAR